MPDANMYSRSDLWATKKESGNNNSCKQRQEKGDTGKSYRRKWQREQAVAKRNPHRREGMVEIRRRRNNQ